MTDMLKRTMSSALAAVRVANPAEATRLIQQGLGLIPRETAPVFSQSSTPTPKPPSVEQVFLRKRRPSTHKSLSETIAALRQFKRSFGESGSDTVLDIPDSVAFSTGRYESAAGSRTYRLYRPTSSKINGLVVMLHGCKQTASDFAVGTNMNAWAERYGLLVAYPMQLASMNAASCWNWFRPHDQERVGGEAEIIAGMARSLVEAFRVPQRNVFAAGLSAGGAMAAVVGAVYPDIFSAVGVHSGLPYGSASDVASAFSAMRGLSNGPTIRRRPFMPRLIVFHGSQDQTVSPINARHLWDDAIASRKHGEIRERMLTGGSRNVLHRSFVTQDEGLAVEEWLVDGMGHKWSGGNPNGSHVDSSGPDASAEMVRFFCTSRSR